MKRLATVVWALALLWSIQPAPADDPVESPGDAPVVRIVDFEANVNPITARRIVRAIEEAEAAGDDFVLIEIDTPGGLVTSMEDIVKSMLSSAVPIVVWVGPAGSHAASAGFFILIAADVAAMAPGTRTGAASTIVMGGENREDDVGLKKMNEDMSALIRSIANRRGRNVEACERAVMDAEAYEETVALEMGLIDLIATDRDELMVQLHGREVTMFDGETRQLRTEGAVFVETTFSIRHQFMEILSHPWVAYMLLLGGLTGIYVEFTNPGVVLPGVVGALCLLLFAISAQTLPISAIGILLILLAIAMFILEVKVTSFGMLTFGGLICLVLGSWMLIPGPIPEMRIPMGMILPVSIAIAAFCAVAVQLAVRAQRSRVETGVEGLETAIGTVTRALCPAGKVFVHGELWDATSSAGDVPEGQRVRVIRVEGMRLIVERADDRPAERS